MNNEILNTIEWRLNVVTSERRIKTITELKRRLAKEADVHISSAQLGRVVWERPQKLSMELLAGLVKVLDCEVSDIMRVVKTPVANITNEAPVSKELNRPKERKERVKPLKLVGEDDLLGPKLTSVPIPPRKK